ncbi:MAG: error-prone DNA polymerase, partial [Thermoleophilia bacterium]|nr:error-prone DNA polymerase [Thermoleophilia bacterium]
VLGKHPLELLRPGLAPAIRRSAELATVEDGAEVEVAGMVVARQRPETAKGIVFMLFEDESGVVNLVVPRQVYDRHRALVRAAPLLAARGRLERREGVINVLVATVWELERTELPSPEPLPSPAHTERREPPPGSSRRKRQRAVAELRAVAPAGHSFGRRG